MTDNPDIDVDVEEPAMSQELTEFLVQLSVTVHRFGMYPPGHPSLEPAAADVVDRLDRLLEDRQSLAIGVASGQFIIEGIATEGGHPVLGDLARRLHGHQIGAISLDRGATVSEIEDACRTLSADSEREGDPIGLLPRDEIPDWDHFHLYALGYDRLELEDSGEGAEGVSVNRATKLWLGLARSALAGEEVDFGDEPPGPQAIAESIRRHRKEEAYDQVIVGHLLQLAEELKSGEGETRQVREQVSHLIHELDGSTLEHLVEMGGAFMQRGRFVLDASQGLSTDATMKILHAAAACSETSISHSMTRLITKLAVHAEGGVASTKAGAGDALRENVEELLADWQLTDPNPEAYNLVLDRMTWVDPILAGDVDDDGVTGSLGGAERLVRMALEVEAFGPIVERAIVALIEEGRIRFLVDATHEVSATQTSDRIREYLADPERLRRILAADEIDVESLNAIVRWMGSTAIDPLLETLTGSESGDLGGIALDALQECGSEVWDGVLRYLKDSRWWVIRNMLLLVQRLDEGHEDFDPTEFLSHPDQRVRRQAFPLGLRSGLRQRTLSSALADDDEYVVRMGLLELAESVPETVVPTLVHRVVLGKRSPEIRAFGIRTAGLSRSPLVLRTLLSITTVGKTIFGGPRLAAKSMEVLAALETLSRFWRDDTRAAKTLKKARRSKDPEIRAAGDAS